MSSNHSGNHLTSGRIALSVLLNALITLLEIAGGILSNSLALISDAVHNLSDTLALALAWTANRVSRRKPDLKRTFGYQRFEILSAFVNASVLTAVSIYLIYEGVVRILHPEPVRSNLMMWIAIAGLVANLFSMLVLQRDSKESLNIRAAYLHLMGDTLSSLAVVAGAIIIHYTGIKWIDPALTLIISLVIIRQAYGILRETVDILMQGTPPEVDLNLVKQAIEKHPLVRNVHHVHCWQIKDHHIHFEGHIETCQDVLVSETTTLIRELNNILKVNFSIAHTTFQIEMGHCDDTGIIHQGRLS